MKGALVAIVYWVVCCTFRGIERHVINDSNIPTNYTVWWRNALDVLRYELTLKVTPGKVTPEPFSSQACCVSVDPELTDRSTIP